MTPSTDLIGKPFAYGGRGPDTFDCYGLVMEMAKRDGVILPDFRSVDDRALIQAMIAGQMQLWTRLERPVPGVVVVFRIGRHISHVGYVLDERNFIHTWEDSEGVLIERLSDWRQRIVGYYRYNG